MNTVKRYSVAGSLALMLLAGTGVAPAQAASPKTYTGHVDWIETYGDGRVRFRFEGHPPVCTDLRGKRQAAFEMRDDQDGVANVIRMLTTAMLADYSVKVYVTPDPKTGRHYTIGCRIYKASITR